MLDGSVMRSAPRAQANSHGKFQSLLYTAQSPLGLALVPTTRPSTHMASFTVSIKGTPDPRPLQHWGHVGESWAPGPAAAAVA